MSDMDKFCAGREAELTRIMATAANLPVGRLRRVGLAVGDLVEQIDKRGPWDDQREADFWRVAWALCRHIQEAAEQNAKWAAELEAVEGPARRAAAAAETERLLRTLGSPGGS